MIEVFVESIRVNMTNYKRVVMLKEKAGERYLPIWVGHFEADAIAIPMQNVPVNRPLTHDFALSAITAAGGMVTQAVVSELTDQTFFAKVVVDVDGRQVEIDSRPSDAVAVAIRAKVPIYVEDAVMDQAGMTFDPDAPSPARSSLDLATVEGLLESALGGAEVSPAASTAEEPAGGELKEAPYLPSAEPAGGRPPEPFGEIGAVSEPVRAALQWVIAEATRSRWMWIGPGDLMLGLLETRRAAAIGVLRALSVGTDDVQALVEREIPRDLPMVSLTPAAEAIARRAVEEASRLDEGIVGTEHLLLALAGQPESSVALALDGVGVSVEAIRRQIAVLLLPPPPADEPS